ncbi:nostrin-like isoform X2 [Limulus polyphemus]|uniref:Nostrin-like isoform X2 n=1 Tax=Limulus polyphemus TaxID=6850 RepID=A0ABM1SX86_LIMPO|nr:nostrin-like isoform X2 [Limulus polyphemus]
MMSEFLRSELESTYSKGLARLSVKLAKASREVRGTVSDTWQEVAMLMEQESELHRNFAVGLKEEAVKPLKTLVECQHKTKKLVESMVERSSKYLSEKRNEEQKMKKQHHSFAKENERIQDQMADSKVVQGRSVSEKDIVKIENKKRKSAESSMKVELDYYSSCLKAERARQQLETATYRAACHFQHLEEERLSHLQELTQKYISHLSTLGPGMVQCSERLKASASCISIQNDIQLAMQIKGTNSNILDPLLPEFYAEDFSILMEKERRQESLERILNLLKQDLELEKKGKQGLEDLVRVFNEDHTPLVSDGTQDHVSEKLQHIEALQLFLEATRYKIQCDLADLEGVVRPVSPLSITLHQYKDKQGTIQTLLKLPEWPQLERRNSSGSWSSCSDSLGLDRGMADGVSVIHEQLDSSSVYSSVQHPASELSKPSSTKTLQYCRAIYTYQANLSDELTLHSGDIICVKRKSDDDWWEGELNGVVGLFPSTYVEEIEY